MFQYLRLLVISLYDWQRLIRRCISPRATERLHALRVRRFCTVLSLRPRQPMGVFMSFLVSTPAGHCWGRAKHLLVFMVKSIQRVMSANVLDAGLADSPRLVDKRDTQSEKWHSLAYCTSQRVRALEMYRSRTVKIKTDRTKQNSVWFSARISVKLSCKFIVKTIKLSVIGNMLIKAPSCVQFQS